jgi:hypothetical protein
MHAPSSFRIENNIAVDVYKYRGFERVKVVGPCNASTMSL